jgi:hypothetical protein
MGGKGRGVFSDFRLGRVGPFIPTEEHATDTDSVPIPNQRSRWKPSGCTEGQLVTLRWEEGDMEHLYYTTRRISGIGRRTSSRILKDHDTFTFHLWIKVWLAVTRRFCPYRLLLPLSAAQT